MDRQQLPLQSRTSIGKENRALRRSGILPVNIHGPKINSLNVQVDQRVFDKMHRTVGETDLIDLVVEGENEPRPALISEIQVDPVTDVVIHIDFIQVDLSVKVEVNVPIELTGTSPAVRDHKSLLLTLMDELPIKVLPTKIPHTIEVDVSKLTEIGDTVTIADAEIPENAELMVENVDEPIAKIEAERVEVEEEEIETPEGEESEKEETEEDEPKEG